MSSSGPVNNTAPSRSVPRGRIVTSSNNYRPAEYFAFRVGLLRGSWRADRPVRNGRAAWRPRRVSGGECDLLWLARDLSGLRFRSPGWWRGEAGDGRGGLEAGGGPEFAQDVRDVDADGLDADDERRGDLAVGVAAGEEVQDLRLARGQAEDFPWAVLLFGEGGRRGREFEPRALGEQFEFAEQRPGPDPGRDGMCLPQRHGRLDTGGAGCGERLGLAPLGGRPPRG